MSKSLYDLNLIGASIIDEVFFVEGASDSAGTSNTLKGYHKAYGGIGNLLAVLKSEKLKMHVSTALQKSDRLLFESYFSDRFSGCTFESINIRSTPKALIVAKDNDKVSYVAWSNLGNVKDLPCKQSKWSHISYLDLLPKLDLKNIRKQSQVLSADLCLTQLNKRTLEKVCTNFKYLDYLFISTNEISQYREHLGINSIHLIDTAKGLIKTLKVRKAVFFHGPFFVDILSSEGVTRLETSNIVRNPPPVVGAGDKLCAFIIAELLKKSNIGLKDLQKAVIAAQNKTSRTLGVYEKI